jgi:hypothetical protein
MNIQDFERLSNREVASLMGEGKTCAFPINGTRRWFLLEHAADGDYLEIAGENHLELYRLLFSHGVKTLITPEFGPDLLERGGAYMQMAATGLQYFTDHPAFLSFYDEMQVRVRFYGDYRQFFHNTPYAYLCDAFDAITSKTASHEAHLLCIGVCASDATDTTAALAVQHYQEHHTVPDKDTLVRLYYGEAIAPVSLFIGFGKPAVFDVPLLMTGDEDLYFTIAPSPYLNQRQLRHILFDHLYSRREPETDYADVPPSAWDRMRTFYHQNQHHTLGVGRLEAIASYWYPLPQVTLSEAAQQ